MKWPPRRAAERRCSASRQPTARAGARWWALVVAAACGDPTYVSLGSNDAPVSDEASLDAGMPCAAPSGSATMVDFTCGDTLDQPPTCTFGDAQVELAQGCDTRPLLACPALGETPERTLKALLSSFLRECAPPPNVLTVRFDQGCALGFELGNVGPDSAMAPLCIGERLSAQRFECARDIACAEGTTFGIPTD